MQLSDARDKRMNLVGWFVLELLIVVVVVVVYYSAMQKVARGSPKEEECVDSLSRSLSVDGDRRKEGIKIYEQNLPVSIKLNCSWQFKCQDTQNARSSRCQQTNKTRGLLPYHYHYSDFGNIHH